MCETIATTLFDDKPHPHSVQTCSDEVCVCSRYIIQELWNVRFRRRLHLKTGWMIHSSRQEARRQPPLKMNRKVGSRLLAIALRAALGPDRPTMTTRCHRAPWINAGRSSESLMKSRAVSPSGNGDDAGGR
jgi:hypothetical protein